MRKIPIVLSVLFACSSASSVEEADSPSGDDEDPSYSSDSEVPEPAERGPVATPDDTELEINAVIPPDAVVWTQTVTNTADKCCWPGSDTGCIDDVNDMCLGGRRLTGCYGCDFVNADDYCSDDYNSGQGNWVGGNCQGFSWLIFYGTVVKDHCSDDNCIPLTDNGTTCTTAVGGSQPNGCPHSAVQTPHFDGALGRMCCRTDAGSPTGYSCIPRSSDQTCVGLGSHTIPSWCHTCPVATDPDGTGIDNTEGGWDLRSSNNPGEWNNSVYCGTNSTFAEPALPDWTGDTCRKVEYVCRGTQVNAINGIVQNDEC